MVPKSSKAELVSFMVTGAACEGLAPAPGDFVVTGAAREGLAPAPGDPDDEQPAASAAAARPAAVAANRSPGELAIKTRIARHSANTIHRDIEGLGGFARTPETRQSRKFRGSYVADADGSAREAMHAVSRRRIWSCSPASRLASMSCSTRRTAALATVS
jgi:hypothetical protein